MQLFLLVLGNITPLQARVPIQLTPSTDVKSALGALRGGMHGVTNYSVWINRKVKYSLAYCEWNTTKIGGITNSFNYLTGNNGICSGLATREPLTVTISLPMVPQDLINGRSKPGATIPNFNRGLAGEWDGYFRDIGKRIAERNLAQPWPDGRPKLIIRFGWESNAKWYSWSSIGSETEYKAYWRRITGIVEQAAGARVVWEWNCSGGAGERSQSEKAYPGDDVVDVVGVDFYDGYYGEVSSFAATERSEADHDKIWRSTVNGAGDGKTTGACGLQWYADFARKHGKKLNISEWAIRVSRESASTYSGGGDDDSFIQQVFCFFSQQVKLGQLMGLNYFETNHSGSFGIDDWHKLSPGAAGDLITVKPGVISGSTFPKSARKFLDLFGGPVSAPSTGPKVNLSAPKSGDTYFAPATFNLSADLTGSALQVDFYNGTDLLGTVRSAPYVLPLSKLKVGQYSFSARATDRDGNVAESNLVKINVAANTAPKVKITSPVAGSTLIAPSDILIAADASDTTGNISKVAFYKGSTLLKTVTQPPYYYVLKNAAAGSYTFKAKATDDGGLTTVSATVSMKVKALSGNSAPKVSVTSPASGSKYNAPANITISASASDANGISQVAFYNGSNLLGADTSAPYGFTWKGVTAGTYSLIAKATDGKGSVKYSNLVTVTVNGVAANAPPIISISSASISGTLTAPASLKIDAAASDPDGSVVRVEFYSGTTLVGSDSTAPFSMFFTDLGEGNYSLTAKAVDNLGAESLSSPLTFSVVNALPEVSITSPTEGQAFDAPGSMTLTANATDANGSISKVEFYQGTTLLGTDTTSPYTFSWTGVPVGTYSITARATDNEGAAVTSSAVGITVKNAVLAAPSGLTATTVSDSQIDLAWVDHSDNETGFRIDRKPASGGSYVKIAKVGANVTLYHDKNLAPGTEYLYRVRAVNADGYSSISNVASASTSGAIPDAPTALSAHAVSRTQIDLSWIDNASNETGFKIERKEGVSGSYIPAGVVGADVEVFSDTGLSPNTEYTYRVLATNSTGDSAYSNESNIKTLSVVPAVPTDLTASVISDSQIDLTWVDHSSKELAYKIERKKWAAGTYQLIATLGANVTGYSDTGLSPNVKYFYRVLASNDTGDSAYSNEASARTLQSAATAKAAASALGGAVYYVATTGNDGNPGTQASPFKTINRAFSTVTGVKGGDTIMVMPGTYTEQVYFNRGGNADSETGYVTLKSQVPLAAKIRPPSGAYSTVMISANYTIIDGFDVVGGSGHAIQVEYTHHNQILNNLTHNSGGSGISAAWGEFYTIENNVSHHNSSSNGYQTSGISIYQARAIAGDTTTTGFRNVVRNNISYDNIESDIPGDGHTDGNGIIMDDFQSTQTAGFPIYPYKSLVENNLVYGNGGKGIQVTWSDHITIRNNTAYHNNVDNQNPGTWRGELNNQQSTDNLWVNNIAVSDPSINSYNSAIGDFAYNGYKPSVKWYNNLTFTGTIGKSGIDIQGSPSTITVAQGNLLGVNPQFVNPGLLDTSDFHLQHSSPAIDSGTSSYGVPANDLDGQSRVIGTMDRGPYESAGDQIPPTIPSGLSGQAVSSSQINLSWIASTDNVGVTGYKIYRNGISIGSTSATSSSDVGLSPATNYSYTVSAMDAAGNVSDPSTSVIVKTLDVTPLAPSDLVAVSQSSKQIDLSWTDHSDNETEFRILRRVGKTGGFAYIKSVGANVTTFSDTGLNPNTQYDYKVRAKNDVGGSSYSNIASAKTQVSAVVNLVVTDDQTSEFWHGVAYWTVRREGDVSEELTVNYSVGGTATNGVDYRANTPSQILTGTVVIPAGSTTALIKIWAYSDSVSDPDETVILTLAPGDGYGMGSSTSGTVIIKESAF